jgi:hypothetical protein
MRNASDGSTWAARHAGMKFTTRNDEARDRRHPRHRIRGTDTGAPEIARAAVTTTNAANGSRQRPAPR